MLKKELERQTSRAEQCVSMKTQLEKQNIQIQELNNKLQSLEHEKSISTLWQQHNKVK